MVNSINNTPDKNRYKDPLNKKSIVLISYSNELGTAISEIAPKCGAALWAPTLMYLGADIYDKYKNDKDLYNPSGKRAFKRAIYQGMTTLIALPAVITAGQWIVSPLGEILHKSGVSVNAKDSVYKHTKDVIDQMHGETLESFEEFNDIVLKTLKNKISARKNEKNSVNFFKKIMNFCSNKFPMVNSDRKKLLEFAQENVRKTFEIAVALKNDDKKKVPGSIYRKYKKLLPQMKEMYNQKDAIDYAARNALKEFQNSLIFKNKLMKTAGGLAALVLLAVPVNNFIDKKIMQKFVDPGIDQISKEFVNNSKLKNIFNEMKNKKVEEHKNEVQIQINNEPEKVNLC